MPTRYDQGDRLPAIASWLATPRTAGVAVQLSAVVMALRDDEPVLLTMMGSNGEAALPSGGYVPAVHGSLPEGLRQVVAGAVDLDLGQVEQLATTEIRIGTEPGIAISYLVLARAIGDAAPAIWRSCYHFLPWEDWRQGEPDVVTTKIRPRLLTWARESRRQDLGDDSDAPIGSTRFSQDAMARVDGAFAPAAADWDETRIVERLDILREAGLVDATDPLSRELAPDDAPLVQGPLALEHFPPTVNRLVSENAPSVGTGVFPPDRGQVESALGMRVDHRRIVAMALERLRRRVKHRPVVPELLGESFTLFDLQKSVEAILGPHLHKQNFRRLVEGSGLLEATGEVRMHTGGRPAKLFRIVAASPRPAAR